MTTIPPLPAPTPPTPEQIALAGDARRLLEDAIRGTGKELKVSLDQLALYTAERSAVLATLVGQPGFEQAVTVERDNVALRGAIEIGRSAAAADQRTIGIIQGILFFGAKKLAGIP